MRLVSGKVLKDFCSRHPLASSAVRHWAHEVTATTFRNFSELRGRFPSADYVAPFTVFNLAGNRFRLIATVNYTTGFVFIRSMHTHAEYDKWSKRYRQGKVKP
jgi:mRNA interferase HigB